MFKKSLIMVALIATVFTATVVAITAPEQAHAWSRNNPPPHGR